MSISIDAEKESDEIQHPIMKKRRIESRKLEMKKERLQQDNKQCRNTKDYKRLL